MKYFSGETCGGEIKIVTKNVYERVRNLFPMRAAHIVFFESTEIFFRWPDSR